MMKMINKSKKRSADKRGVILVTVLFILATAMIFISSALLLTSATRGRVYQNAEKSQARLTLTSAVETFVQALQMQEITDAALETYASEGAKIQFLMDSSTIPGMYAAGPGGQDNVTWAHFYGTKLKGKDYIVVDITTKIGDSQENAKLFLYEDPQPDPPDLFNSQIDFNGNLGNNFRGAIGKHNFSTNPSDNLIVWRGSTHLNQSEYTKTWSDMLFVGKSGQAKNECYFENSEIFYGDLIFMDGYTLSEDGTDPHIYGNVYFLGPKDLSNKDSFSGTVNTRKYSQHNNVWTFVNRKANVNGTEGNGVSSGKLMSGMKDAKQINFLTEPATGKWEGSTKPLSGALAGENTGTYSAKYNTWKSKVGDYTSVVNKAKKYYTNDLSTIVQEYPTTSQMKSNYGMPVTATDCTSAAGWQNKTMSWIAGYAGKVLPAGKYVVGAGYADHQGKGAKAVLLDGNEDYMFFFTGDLKLENFIFAVVNPNPEHNQYFILGPGVTLTLNTVNSGDSGNVSAGFMSLNRDGSSDASTYASKISSMSMATCHSAYDGKQKPTIYIYGMNCKQIYMTRGSVLEAYVGMFQSGYGSSTCDFTVDNGTTSYSPCFCFYGRIMATNIKNQSADFDAPYCPAPTAKSTEEYIEVSSKYKVSALQYYTGTGVIPSNP